MSYRVMFPLAFIALLGFAGANGQVGPPGSNGGGTGGNPGSSGGGNAAVGGNGWNSTTPFFRGNCCGEKNAGAPANGRYPQCWVEGNGGAGIADGMEAVPNACGGCTGGTEPGG